uniref:Ribosomal protein S7 n=1 Tax=Babesia duncani TaxID=323732 RepID=A0A385GNG7_9APIC|nr:ribosomal protein S7 [Babesia duncani]
MLLKEFILNKFTKLVQKKGKYTIAKKVLINSSLNLYEYNNYFFINVLEYIVKELILPIKDLSTKKFYKIKFLPINYIKSILISLLSLLRSIKNLKKILTKKIKKKYSIDAYIVNELKNFLENDDNKLYENKNELSNSFLTTKLYDNNIFYNCTKNTKLNKSNLKLIFIKKNNLKLTYISSNIKKIYTFNYAINPIIYISEKNILFIN